MMKSIFFTLFLIYSIQAKFTAERFYSQNPPSSVNVYALVDGNSGLIIDSGFGTGTAAAIKAKYPTTTFSHLWLTHEHPDHISGINEMKAAFPGIKIMATSDVVHAIEHEAPAAKGMVTGYDLTSLTVGTNTVMIIPVGGQEVKYQSLVLYDGTLFAGDVLAVNAHKFVAAVDDLDVFITTMRGIHVGRGITRIAPGHGVMSTDIEGTIKWNVDYMILYKNLFTAAHATAPSVSKAMLAAYPTAENPFLFTVLNMVGMHFTRHAARTAQNVCNQGTQKEVPPQGSKYFYPPSQVRGTSGYPHYYMNNHMGMSHMQQMQQMNHMNNMNNM